MSRTFLFAALAGLLASTGCATRPQEQIALQATALQQPTTRVGVALNVLPKVEMQFPGAECLLCRPAAAAANLTLSRYTQKLPEDSLAKTKSDVADLLRKKGYQPVLLPDDFDVRKLPTLAAVPNKSKYDFSSVRRQYGIDKLIVFEFSQVGIARNYSDYFPTGAPHGAVYGAGYLVNLLDNSYEWYQPIREVRSVAGVWNEPPNFPGVTKAYFGAVEGARDAVLKPFAN